MNDDEITRRVAETLRAEAARIKAPPDAWEHFSAASVTPGPGSPRSRLWFGVPAAALGVAAAAALIVVATSGSHHPTQVSGVGGSTSVAPAPASTTTTPQPVGPPAGPVPKGFAPASVTFVSASSGWVLGTAPCAKPPCTSVVRTTDGGRTWAGIAAPRAPLNVPAGAANSGVSTIRFANRTDGWAFGPDLWSTHDGGATWHQVPLAATNATVEDLEASGGRVHVALTTDTGEVRLETSAVGADLFTPAPVRVLIGAGPVPSGQIVLHGAAGWFVQVDRTVVGGARLVNGQWTQWTPPCATAGGPAWLTVTSDRDLEAACDVGLWTGGSAQERLFVSHDGGTTFTDTAGIPQPSVAAIAATPAAIVVGVPTGTLIRSADQGVTWATAYHRAGTSTFADVGFTTATQGVAVLVSPATLLMTHDAGRTWAAVTFR